MSRSSWTQNTREPNKLATFNVTQCLTRLFYASWYQVRHPCQTNDIY